MARGSSQAREAAASAQGLSNQYAANAAQGFNALMPELQTEVAHPAGFNPTDLARMNTSAQQGAGGSNAAAVGQGALLAGRTKNPGTAAAAIPEAIRRTGEQQSKNALGVQTANAALREKQRQAGMEGLQNLTESQAGTGVRALGEVAPAVDANTKAASQSWDWARTILDPALEAAGKGASAGLAPGGAFGCWIAEAIYGETDARTFMIREWLNGPFLDTAVGPLVMRLYLRFGQRIAAQVRKSKMLRRMLKPLFDLALRKALQQHYRDQLILNL